MNDHNTEPFAIENNIELQPSHPDISESPENATVVSTFEDIPPNGGYGWVCTFCVFMINVHTWGVNSAWGVILNYYLSHSTFPGASHLDFAIIGGLSISQCLLIGPIVAKANDIMGTRLTLLIGTSLIFAALFTASYATEVWHLFLSQGICFGIGMGFTYLTATAILPKWFSTKRSFSSGLAASGAGLGGLAYNLAAERAIETVGVRNTYRILAFCALGSNLLSSLLLKDRPRSHTPSSPRTLNHRDLGHLEVLLVSVWGMSTDLGYIALIYSLPNYASSIGLTSQQGSVAGAILNLGLAVGRPLVGYISDTYGRITISMAMTATCAVLCLAIWIPAHSYALLLLFALLGGMVCGTFWSTIAPVLTDIVGLNRLPSTFGLICLTLVAPSTVAEAIALSMVGSSGYLSTQVYISCMFILGACCLCILRSWKFYEIEKKASVEREGAVSSFPNYFRWMRPQKLFLLGRV
ncbi:hypothetical protein ASPCADRAFT_518599 [Aspergillus carbonarius ITEM 5010]|uniref:Major facilitator superfamily (MFS) profile domain-containing protein n=1 Tax=Aspergillus carbonarius (strain ITEM 5010) TaxID=602072 RepID=A0A1R3RA51_ASPC5|nr:hypothetical protein ASPCADRAFT_518599 [Aspergillus carbonarius ITEM 5010]